MIYMYNRIVNCENPPKLEEIMKEIDEGFTKELKKEDKELSIEDKKKQAENMLNMAKKLNAQFGGHMPK